ncbi:MAG: hypothetical protein ABH821_02605 [archaeon]
MKKIILFLLLCFFAIQVTAFDLEITVPSTFVSGDQMYFDYFFSSDYEETIYFTPMIVCDNAPLGLSVVESVDLNFEEGKYDYDFTGNYHAYILDSSIDKQDCKAVIQTRFQSFEKSFALDLGEGMYLETQLCSDNLFSGACDSRKVFEYLEFFYPRLTLFNSSGSVITTDPDVMNAAILVYNSDLNVVEIPLIDYNGDNPLIFGLADVNKTFVLYSDANYTGFNEATKTISFAVVEPGSITFSLPPVFSETPVGFITFSIKTIHVGFGLLGFGVILLSYSFLLRRKNKNESKK